MQESTGLRIVLAGSPAFAAEYLATLLESRHQVVAAYTQPDRPSGRGKKLTPNPVKALALDHELPVYQPLSLRDTEAQQTLASLEADVMVVVAYGLILPQAVLDTPRFGCLNVHASLLPRWRGAAPIQRAIEAGDSETGVTIMQMEAGLDTGPMLAVARCDIGPRDTAGDLLDRLSRLGREPLLSVLDQLPRGGIEPEPQDDSRATYANKIDKSEAALDWELSAELLDRKIRAFNPFPVAYSLLRQQRIKIHRARPEASSESVPPGTLTAATDEGILVQCGNGSLRIEALQLPGKRSMWVKEVLLGNRALFAAGERFHRQP